MNELAQPKVARQAASGTQLHEPWSLLARLGWLAFAVSGAGLYSAGLVLRYSVITTDDFKLLREVWTPDLNTGLLRLVLLGIPLIVFVVFYVVAALIILLKSEERIGVFTAYLLVALAVAATPTVWNLAGVYPEWILPVMVIWTFGFVSVVVFCYLFPDGRFIPRWTRAPAALAVVLGILAVITSYTADPYKASQPSLQLPYWFTPQGPGFDVTAPLTLALLSTAIYAQLIRYSRISTFVQRQQTRWVVYGASGAMLLFFFSALLPILFPPLVRDLHAAALYDLFTSQVTLVGLVLVPVTIGISMFRYRLWDLDPLVNRTLVYGGLTLLVVALYVVVVSLFGALFQQIGNLAISLLATGVVAILFQPLRERLQRAVNRLMYGERDDPYQVLSRLGQRLEATVAPAAVLPSIVETVAQALKLPYAAIALKQGDAFETAAEQGTRPAWLGTDNPALELPLVYQGETIGRMILAPRAPGESFGPPDLRLLDDLAREAGAAAYTVRLTADLQRSREWLVTAREEERRRLRRDLHDGLGPTLASVPLQLEALRNLMQSDPAAANQLITDLEMQTQTAITDVRRLVYELRPPALDDLGLVSALRQHAARTSRANGLEITVEAPDSLPALPAAVEVVTYRIAMEAMTNVVRHAGARHCLVKLWLDDRLRLEVTDDGIGILSDRHAGIGLNSMRERAAELGGSCKIEPQEGGGTRAAASIPLPGP